MAKPAVSQLLRPAQSILTRQQKSLPENTLLIRKRKHPGPPLPPSETENRPLMNYGQHIYLYNNIRTNQVVYSLTRHLNNTKSLNQLPNLGKKTKPPHLRKDHWTPLCLATFPNPHAGLAAYRKLREYRRLHETSYPLSLITSTSGPHTGQLMSRIPRGKVLMDQKANSVADLAAVLLQQEAGPSARRKDNATRRIRRTEHLREQKGAERVGKAPLDVGRVLQGVKGVRVMWANVLDAEFAKRWPQEVVHARLEKSRYTAAFPVVGEGVGGEVGMERVVDRAEA